MNDEEVAQGIHKVETFAEKPNFATAKRFVKSGDFFWNSGMFIWRSDSILNELEEYMPDLYNKILDVREAYGTDNFEETLLNITVSLKVFLLITE